MSKKELTEEQILKDKVVIISEDDRFADNTKHPTKFFIVNAFGEGVYFRTRSRLQAQKWANILYGDNFYGVREAIKASVH